MLSSRNRDGSTPSKLAEVPQRDMVTAQSTNIGSRFLTMSWVFTLVPLVPQVCIYTSQAFLNANTGYEMCYP